MKNECEYVPICPNCETKIDNWHDFDFTGDGDIAYTECVNCGRALEIIMNVTVSFNTEVIG